jgi:hypothetical protein
MHVSMHLLRHLRTTNRLAVTYHHKSSLNHSLGIRPCRSTHGGPLSPFLLESQTIGSDRFPIRPSAPTKASGRRSQPSGHYYYLPLCYYPLYDLLTAP